MLGYNSLLNKAKKSTYDKDKVFVNLYNELEDKKFYQNNNLPLVTPFVNKRSNIDHSALSVLVNLLNYCMLILLI